MTPFSRERSPRRAAWSRRAAGRRSASWRGSSSGIRVWRRRGTRVRAPAARCSSSRPRGGPAGYARRVPAIGYGPILDADPAWHRELRIAAESRVADGLRMWLGNPFSGRLPGVSAELLTGLLDA